jgi:hypothetical protein
LSAAVCMGVLGRRSMCTAYIYIYIMILYDIVCVYIYICIL